MTAGRLGKAERPLRFLVGGAINTAFGLAFYPLLLWSFAPLRTHYMVALGIAQVVSTCFAFAVYKFGVFRTRGNTLNEFRRFVAFYLVNYVLNWAALPLMVELAGIPPVIAQLAFAVLVVIGSWFWHNHYTFKPAADPGSIFVSPERD